MQKQCKSYDKIEKMNELGYSTRRNYCRMDDRNDRWLERESE